MKKLRVPPIMVLHSRIERCGEDELLRLFETCRAAGPKRKEYSLLPAIWGRLFSIWFLSAEELLDLFERGEHGIDPGNLGMLREFVAEDCHNGALFVIEVIRNGGSIDRAALVMMADPSDLAGIESGGRMAIQLLLEACDRKVRPALIHRMGKHLLADVCDSRDLPLVYTIFGLTDISMDDLDAIASVMSAEELEQTMSRKRTGRNALEVFRSVAEAMKRYPSYEREAFMVRNAFYFPAVKRNARKDVPQRPVKVREASQYPDKK